MAYSTPRSSHRPDEEWSNRNCIAIAFEDSFPSTVMDIMVQKRIIEQFLNYYLGGRIQQGIDAVYDLVYSTISIMPLHESIEEFIWDITHYRDDGTLFFLTPEDRLKAEIRAMGKGAKNKEEAEKSGKDINAKEHAWITNKDKHSTVNEDTEKMKYQTHSQEEIDKTLIDEVTDSDEDEEKVTWFEKLTPDNEKSSEKDQNDVPKSSTSKSEENRRPKGPTSPIEFPEKIRWFSNKRKRPVLETTPLQYGPVENAAFVNSCNKLLEKWDTSVAARAFLKYLFGIVALTFLRATTKSYKHMVNTFSSIKFLNNLPRTPDFKYSIPHKKCVKRCYRTFCKRGSAIRIMFAKIVVNSYHIDNRRKELPHSPFMKMNMFKVTVLAHTAEYGLGLLSLVQTVQNLSLNQINSVIKTTFCEDTVESWGKLMKFVNKYMVPSTKECTHHWARLIDWNFFSDLTCSSNYPLAVILAVFCEKMDNNPDIWKSTWVDRGEKLETYKNLGLGMYQKYTGG